MSQPAVRIALAALLLLVAGCGSETPACGSDDDCSEGFQCKTDGPYAGECVRFVAVEACGDDYCERPERCIRGACRLPGGGPADGDGGATDADGLPAGDATAPGDGGPGPGRDAGPADPDAAPNVAPIILIDAPTEGAAYVEERPVLAGTIEQLAANATVTWRVDDGQRSPLGITGGRFRLELDVGPGDHTVAVTATQGPFEVEAAVSFRADFRVRASGGELRLGGRPFHFVGLVAPGLREAAYRLGQGGADEVDEVLRDAKALGATVLRVPAYDDRPEAPSAIQVGRDMYNEPGLVALDVVVDRAGKAGLKLVLPLVGWTGGVDQYLRWNGYLAPVPADRALFFNAGPIREHFKAHVRHLLARTNTVNGRPYRDDPTILGWEVLEGVDGAGLFDPSRSGEELRDFFTDLTTTIKTAAPDQLAGTGEIGFDAGPAAHGRANETFGAAGLRGLLDGSHAVAWQRNVRIATVDFASIQLDPGPLGFPVNADQYVDLGAAWMRGHASIAATESKPLLVSVARMNANVGLDLAARRRVLQAWLAEAASLEVAGILAGNFHPDAAPQGQDPYGWVLRAGTAPEDAANQYADLVQAAAAALP